MSYEDLDAQMLYLFNEGTQYRLYQHLGAHRLAGPDHAVRFAVWAPTAQQAAVIGDFNSWDSSRHPMQPRGNSGVYVTTIEGLPAGTIYKYFIRTPELGFASEKADPISFAMEVPPKTASVITDLTYDWQDGPWMRQRHDTYGKSNPMSIYEVHLGSWRKHENLTSLSYRELAEQLVAYVGSLGFTHVEFLPVMEHPYYGSWGYQTTSYFAPSSRFGTPQDLMYLIDCLHKANIGVILDWVPSHFATDAFGLGQFDGSHLYEHSDPRQGIHPQWQSYLFNYGRNEVKSFLISSAMFWLDVFHADGLRVDAVSSMLYLDFGREQGQWIPNRYGGHENLEAIDFLRQLNDAVHKDFPGALMIAEESTAWPGVTAPTGNGGLGFDFKWDMGWMHDTLDYMALDSVYRRYHQDSLTFRPMYALSERFVLPLSHDEVVHGKGSLLSKMSGDTWQKFANLRLLLAYLYAVPGKKLLFMGAEIGQWREWSHDRELDWFLLNDPFHPGVTRLVHDLNGLYAATPSLWVADQHPEGFEWCDFEDRDASIMSFFRKDGHGNELLCAFNFTPVPRHHYCLGIPRGGSWREVFNSDAEYYGGSNQGNLGEISAQERSWKGRPWCLDLTLPPLAAVFLTPVTAETD
jgi:1,4-alpha-glucan branching enzyme